LRTSNHCGDTALAQDLDKQQGGHQFAVADQFVGQRG
jgi:hypothetical protein